MKKRTDGRIEKKVTVGKSLDGKPIRKAFYGKTIKEVDEKIRQFKSAVYSPVDNSITLKEWAEKWLEAYKDGVVRSNTYETTYRYAVDKHILPYFGKARLSAIRSIDIQQFYNSLSRMSASTLNKVRISINSIFDTAIENDLIVKNPAKKIRPKSDQTKTERQAYNIEEVNQLITFAKTHKYGVPVIVLLKTGLRRGELLGLKWTDINFKTLTLSVERSITTLKGGAQVGETKTLASKADIPFDNELKEILLPLKGIGYILVKNGKPINPNYFTKYMYNVLMEDYKAAFPDARILHAHELRHTYGTLVYESTHDIHITSKLMRHSNIDTTSKVYVHEEMDAKRDAITKTFTTV